MPVTITRAARARLAARRWGPGVGGWLAGLPLTSAPVSVFLALEQGPDFAAGAAVGTLLGLTALGRFCFAYGHAARYVGWAWSPCLGLAVFAQCLALLSTVPVSLPAAFAVFFLVVGGLLGRLGVGATYGLASLGALAVNGAALAMGRRLLR